MYENKGSWEHSCIRRGRGHDC